MIDSSDNLIFQGSIHQSGSCIAIAHTDFSVRIYNMASGNVVACAKGLPSPIAGVSLLEGGRLVASSSDGCVLAWDVPASTIAACQVWNWDTHVVMKNLKKYSARQELMTTRQTCFFLS